MNQEKFYSIVSPYSMTSKERINCLYDSLEYIRLNNIKGDIIECGVWKGGNILGIMEYFSFHNITNKQIWMYDTFSGMTSPEDIDVDYSDASAKNILSQVMCVSPLNEVMSNLQNSSYPLNKIKIIEGDICETLLNPVNVPNSISLLRLDTDWYKSTKIELEILYPKLEKNGVLIVDDYGHWRGAQQVVDEYFAHQNIIIEKIDYTGIKIIK
jgi:O-methyltransferase